MENIQWDSYRNCKIWKEHKCAKKNQLKIFPNRHHHCIS